MSNAIESLSQITQANNIEEIIDAITIQTDLLALNTAIEARNFPFALNNSANTGQVEIPVTELQQEICNTLESIAVINNRINQMGVHSDTQNKTTKNIQSQLEVTARNLSQMAKDVQLLVAQAY